MSLRKGRSHLMAHGPLAVYWSIGGHRLEVRRLGGQGYSVAIGSHLEPSTFLELGHGTSRAAGWAL